MFFAKDEVIELNDQKHYIILEVALINNEVFYQIQEVDNSVSNVTGSKKTITATNNNGTLYIEEITNLEQLAIINKEFTS